jgi:leucine efflux protein
MTLHAFGIVELWTYIISVTCVILLPGPNSLYVLAVSSQQGVRDGYRAASGVFLGDAILMTLSVVGVASLLQAYPVLFYTFKYGGAVYLLYLGMMLLSRAWRQRRHIHRIHPHTVDASQPFRKALMASLLNPKAILFFMSYFIQFVDPGYAYPVLSFMVLGAITHIISALYLSMLIFTGARLAELFRCHRYLSTGALSSAGVLFIGFSMKLATATLD